MDHLKTDNTRTPATTPPQVPPITPDRRHFVGSVFRLTRPCLGNPTGTLGVVYEIYARPAGARPWDRDGGRWGHSLLFTNGAHDGFSAREMAMCLVYVGEAFDPALTHYRFTDVNALNDDYRCGRFDSVFIHRQIR